MLGTSSIGIKAPIYKPGDDVFEFICTAIKNSKLKLEPGDVLGITESIVARSQNNYCTIDDIAVSVKQLFPNSDIICLYEPIASRNRFSYILKGFARAFKEVYIIWQNAYDEVGNYIKGKHPFTGIDYREFYKNIVEEEGSKLYIYDQNSSAYDSFIIDCRCHVDTPVGKYTLKDVMKEPISNSGYNSEYGVLGSNIAGDNILKLFPRNGNDFARELHEKIRNQFHINIDCLIFADGAFKDPAGGIWEYADPITCPGSTIGWDVTPNELKLKLLADTKTYEEIQKELKEARKKESESIKSQALGTTPRRVNDLLASLMDLTSGSGDKGTPIVLVKNYFTHYDE